MHNASASKKIKCLEMYQIEFQLELTGAVGTKLVVVRSRRRSGAFTVNFEDISHLVIVFLLLTLSR